MSAESNSLMPAARGELATVAGANPLVARGLAAVAAVTNGPDVTAKMLEYYATGTRLYFQREYEQAIPYFDEAIRLAPGLHDHWARRGSAWANLGHYSRAIADYDETLRLDPNDVPYRADRGRIHFHYGHYELALSDFNEVIRRHPHFWEWFYDRSNCWYRLGNNEKAMSDLEEAIRINANFTLAYDAFVWLLAIHPETPVRNPKRAIEIVVRACQITNSADGWELVALAAAYAKDGQYDMAVRHMMKVIANRSSDDPNLFSFRRYLELYRQQTPLRKSE